MTPLGRSHAGRRTTVGLVRDIVEVAAIIAAGAWAFYIFVYENRIKPSWANPEVTFAASMQRVGETNGLIAVRLHQSMHNFGAVPAYFLGVAVDVYGLRATPILLRNEPPQANTQYKYQALYRTSKPEPVYSLAYVTRLADPASTQFTDLDPGDTLENDYTFYVPRGRYDLLTLEINGVFVKSQDRIPARIVRASSGAAKISASKSTNITTYDTNPVTSLSL